MLAGVLVYLRSYAICNLALFAIKQAWVPFTLKSCIPLGGVEGSQDTRGRAELRRGGCEPC